MQRPSILSSSKSYSKLTTMARPANWLAHWSRQHFRKFGSRRSKRAAFGSSPPSPCCPAEVWSLTLALAGSPGRPASAAEGSLGPACQMSTAGPWTDAQSRPGSTRHKSAPEQSAGRLPPSRPSVLGALVSDARCEPTSTPAQVALGPDSIAIQASYLAIGGRLRDAFTSCRARNRPLIGAQ